MPIGVSNCYVFKSQLQEYAQKVGLSTPVYDTIKEGPSHEPFFRSSVIVNNVKYDSLHGFSNRKVAEQSAAEVALLEIAKAGNANERISNPLHESGLCKNLLQEYAQKMNYAIPSYSCRTKNEPHEKQATFSCTVEVGGVQYIGAVARTKKEAEIKAARTALLATIHSNTSSNEAKTNGNTQLTVLPCKRKPLLEVKPKEETTKSLKPKKGNFKKNWQRRKSSWKKSDRAQNDPTGKEIVVYAPPTYLGANFEMLGTNTGAYGGQYTGSELNQSQQQGYVTEANRNLSYEQTELLNFNQSDQGVCNMEALSEVQINEFATLVSELNDEVSEIHEVAPIRAYMGPDVTKEGLHFSNSFIDSTPIEDGRMYGGDGNMQRCMYQQVEVQVSSGVYQQGDGYMQVEVSPGGMYQQGDGIGGGEVHVSPYMYQQGYQEVDGTYEQGDGNVQRMGGEEVHVSQYMYQQGEIQVAPCMYQQVEVQPQ